MKFDLGFLKQYSAMQPQSVYRGDDTQFTAFLEQQLRQVVTKTYDRLFVELDARQHIPIRSDIAPGAMAWAYDSFDQRGLAKFLSAAGEDIPLADISVDRTTFPIKSIVSGYGWTMEELMAAQFAGVPINERKAVAARRAIAELEHSILLSGSPNEGLPGFLTNPSVPLMTVPNGSWLNVGTTADQMVADLNAMADSAWINTKRVHRADTILLPLAQYRVIQEARLPNTQTTVREFFLQTNGFVRSILPLTELATAGPSSAPRAIAYAKSEENLSGVVPVPFQQMEPQQAGFRYVIPVWSRQGGTVFYRPFSAVYADGI